MFDFSFAELFIIIAAAIFLIGPKDIPAVLKSLGQSMRRLQYIRYSMSEQFEKFMQENDLNEIRHYSVDPMKDNSPSSIEDEKELDEDVEMLPLSPPHQQDLKEYAKSLKPFCSKATAYRPGKWRKNNPLFDHCVPVSLVIQDKFGGDLKIVDAIHKENPDDHVGHVYNTFNGLDFDGTKEQFKGNYKFIPKDDESKEFTSVREYLLSDVDVETKYKKFKEKVESNT